MTAYVAVLTFPERAEAYEAMSSLKSSPVGTAVTAGAIVERDAAGQLTIPDGVNTDTGSGFLTGSLIGLLVGVLGGPLGMLLGWGIGATAGSVSDLNKRDDQTDALMEIAAVIPNGKNALVLETEEGDVAALDHFVADRGGAIVRKPLDEVITEMEAHSAAAKEAQKAAQDKLKEERKRERKESREERLAKLQAR